MNKQKITVLIGCFSVAAMVLFPPYLGVTSPRHGKSVPRFIGYYSILSPPGGEVVYERMFNKPFFYISPDRGPFESDYTAQIDLQRLTIQILAIMIVTAGLVFVLKEPQKSQHQASERDD